MLFHLDPSAINYTGAAKAGLWTKMTLQGFVKEVIVIGDLKSRARNCQQSNFSSKAELMYEV